MKKTIVSLSFDDGREDTYRVAYNIMKKYGITGTIHVTTGYIDGTWKPDDWKTSKGPISIEQLREMKQNGFEISSHGDRHITDKEDLLVSISKLKRWDLIDDKVGFSIPNSKLTEQEKNDFLRNNDIYYMRGGRIPQCYNLKSKVIYGMYVLFKVQYLYDLFNSGNLISTNNDIKPYDLYSIVIRKEDDPKTILRFINNQSKKSKWLIFMLHSIQSKSEQTYGKDPWCWEDKKFEKFCMGLKKMLDEGNILIEPIINVIKHD